MEIDFLGLNSTTGSFESDIVQEQIFSTDRANFGVETSLSLSTTPFLHCRREIEKKKKWGALSSSSDSSSISAAAGSSFTEKQSLLFVPPPPPPPATTAAAALFYDLRNKSTQLRKMCGEISASITMPYHHTLHEEVVPRQCDDGRIVCSTRRGYIPTVAMARRATLARFLEKRFHRLNQTKKAHVMGKSTNKQG